MNADANSASIMAVDDEPFDLMLIDRYLSRAGFRVTRAAGGTQAWKTLHEPGGELPRAILLDRQMPGMDGMKFLALLGADPLLRDIPVIMQTGLAEPEQIIEGIASGARYYLAKPFTGDVLVAIVRSAVNDFRNAQALRAAVGDLTLGRRFLRDARFELRTLDDARILASHLAQYFPFPQRVALGISEILINAVEHGNLGLTYADKSEFLKSGDWDSEIQRRLELPEHRDKRVIAELILNAGETVLKVTDEGAGFDWLPFLEIQPERVFDLHGRGIAMSRLMSFDKIDYRGRGNEVELTVFAGEEAATSLVATPEPAARDAA